MHSARTVRVRYLVSWTNPPVRGEAVGRTVRTFREAIDIEEARWKDFRRTLKSSWRELFDHIFDNARKHADAGTMIVTPRITEVVLVSTAMELLREIDELHGKIAVLEKQVEET